MLDLLLRLLRRSGEASWMVVTVSYLVAEEAKQSRRRHSQSPLPGIAATARAADTYYLSLASRNRVAQKSITLNERARRTDRI